MKKNQVQLYVKKIIITKIIITKKDETKENQPMYNKYTNHAGRLFLFDGFKVFGETEANLLLKYSMSFISWSLFSIS